MKIGIIGSRCIEINNLEDYLPDGITEIISGGAKGVDSCARKYAKSKNIPLTEYLPEYNKFRKSAPIIRNKLIVQNSDAIYAFWDGKSRGTMFTIKYARRMNKNVKVFTKE